MTKSAIYTGIGLVIFGIWLFFKILGSQEGGWLFIYPILIIAGGIAMMVLWKSEDIIEKRRD